MNRLFRLLTVGFFLFYAVVLMAQPTFTINSLSVEKGDQIEVLMTVDDFTDISDVALSLNWDVQFLEFIEITDVNKQKIADLDFNKFDERQVAVGKLGFDWRTIGIPSIKLDDGTWFFKLKYKTLQSGTTSIMFSDDPLPVRVVRDVPNVNNPIYDQRDLGDGGFLQDGEIVINAPFSTMTPPSLVDSLALNLVPDKDLYCIGEQLCYTMQVGYFDKVIEFQTPIVWDNSILKFERTQNSEIAELQVQDFNEDGYLIMIMDVPVGDALETGFTLADSTSLIDICFEVVGEQNGDDLIAIEETPASGTQQNFSKYEVIGSSATIPLALSSSVTGVESVNCDELVILNTTCESGSEGEEVCISVRANNFPNVGNFLYSHTWDPTIMDYVGIRSENSALSGIKDDPSGSSVMISWTAQGTTGVSFDQNNTMYDLCFKLKDGVQEGQSSTVKINTDESFFDQIDGTPIDDKRISDGCSIEVEAAPLPTVKLSVADTTTVNEGSTVCIDIVVENFKQVDFLQFPLTWDEAVLRYIQKDNDQLDNISIKEIGDNQIVLEWESPGDPKSLDDGTAIVSICFEAIGDAKVQETSESAIVFSGTEDILIARNTIPLPFETPVPGLVILNQVALSAVTISSEPVENKKRGEIFCVPVTAANFNNILSIRLLMTWDSTVLAFEEVKNFNQQFPKPIREFDFNSATSGQLNFVWLDDANLEPVTVDNGLPLFEVCFQAIGDLGEETRLEFPTTLQTSGGVLTTELINDATSEELNIIDEGQNISITPFGIETESVIQPNCGGDGSIEIEIAGSSGYFGNWLFYRDGVARDIEQNALPPNNRLLFEIPSNDIDSVCVNVRDRIDGNLNDSKCWKIEISDERVPEALAGEDLETGCGAPGDIAVELNGDYVIDSLNASTGVTRYSWIGLNGGVIDPFKPNGQTATATSAGTYVLTVTFPDTGCSARDTLEVRQSSLPEISVGDVDNITCKVEKVKLVGQGQETGANYQYEWRTASGETLNPISTFEAEAEQAGEYIFRVENTFNNCINEQRVTVFENKDFPIADAGGTNGRMVMRCEDNGFLKLDGLGSTISGAVDPLWTRLGEGSPDIIQPNDLEPTVKKTGFYVLSMTDRPTGCVATDTLEIIADDELPDAQASPMAFIGCGERPEAILDGSPTRTNANFLYSWVREGRVLVEGRSPSILDETVTRDTGEHLLIIINTENDNCIADTAVVNVSIDDTKPQIDIPSSLTVGCSNNCMNPLDLPAVIDNQDSYTFEWSTEDGFICGGENSATAQISTLGTYRLVTTNSNNNCSDTSNVIIYPDAENNVGADAGASQVLTCGEEMVVLNGTGSSKEPSHVHEWRFDGEFLSDSLEVMVSQPGTYELIVRDTETGCEDNASVKVTEDKNLPKVDAGEKIEFSGCEFPNDPPIKLVATNSDSGEEFEISWTTSDGILTGDTTSLITTIGKDGIYTLTITNKETGCVDSSQVVVSAITYTPVAIIESVDQIDCSSSSLTLDAQGSDVDPNVQIEWSTIGGNVLSGESTLNPVIDAPGTYTLKLTAANGCEDKADIVINANEEVPEAKVVMDNLRIFCNEPMMIDASESSMGENIVASWTTSNGQIISGANTLLPEIKTGGTYLLTIEDTLSNCKATKEVVVESDGNLPAARAGDNQEVCEREAVLKASTPSDNVSGIWKAVSEGAISTDGNAETSVDDLSPGENKFVWTLSSVDCPDYSSDTVSVNVATVPVATADNFTVTNDQPTVQLDLVQNDQTSSLNFDVNILTSLSAGSLTEVEEGIYEFSIPDNFLGRQEFEYEICSKACSEICANASVTLAVRPIALEAFEGNPNAITPNGDGRNDQLIFDQLFFEDFKDSELVIFNRWGDVVYKESPYNNDWQGLSADGTTLPEGTYYYVLRLHIGEGEIIRGEVTVLR